MKQKAELSEEVEELRQMIDAMEVGLEKTQENREKAEGTLEVWLSFTVTTNVNKQGMNDLKEKVMSSMEIVEEVRTGYPDANVIVKFEDLSSPKYK